MKRRINTRGRHDVILRRLITSKRDLRIADECLMALNSFMCSDEFLREVMPAGYDPVITAVSDDVVHVEVSVPMDRVELSCQLKYQ